MDTAQNNDADVEPHLLGRELMKQRCASQSDWILPGKQHP